MAARSRGGLTTAANFCGRWEIPGGHASDVAPLATVAGSPRRIGGCYSKLVKIHGQATILVVDDEALIRWSLAERLKAEGYEVLEAETGAAALEQLPEGVDLVLLDYRLPDTDGVTVLRKIKEFDQDILVILLTAYASVETAVEAMKLGAYHFANKPFNLDEVAATVARALETTRLRREVRQLPGERGAALQPGRASSASRPAMTALRQLVARVAASPASTVLLTGESGTGKDLVAKIIHYTSDRAARPFMNITCSALPEQLLESELFGHERGAFTDARLQKRGLLETADGGTVFLDEIGEMVPALQAKLLRFLEEKSVQARRRRARHPRRRARRRRDQPQPRGGGRKGRVPQRPVLPAERAADRDAAAARASRRTCRCSSSTSSTASTREFRKRVQRRDAGRLRARCSATAGRATCASCATWSSARCCCRTATARAGDFAALVDGDRSGRTTSSCPQPASTSRSSNAASSSRRSSAAAATRRRPAALLGLNRDQIRYRIEKFGLTVSH